MGKPTPQSIRDLRLMYETARRIDGMVEYKSFMPKVRSSRDYHEGDITNMALRVIPSNYRDVVTVCVQREQVTNLRDGCYNPKRLTDWSKEYTFAEFVESPFYQMCIEAWDGCSWDTHEMDDHEALDEDTRWSVYAHIYEYRRTWLGNWDKTGNIDAVNFCLDEDGGIELSIKHFDKIDRFYSGDIWELRRIVEEHEEMRQKLERLKEHGIDLEDGTLSIKLWEEK
jgi:hypothetical protein